MAIYYADDLKLCADHIFHKFTSDLRQTKLPFNRILKKRKRKRAVEPVPEEVVDPVPVVPVPVDPVPVHPVPVVPVPVDPVPVDPTPVVPVPVDPVPVDPVPVDPVPVVPVPVDPVPETIVEATKVRHKGKKKTSKKKSKRLCCKRCGSTTHLRSTRLQCKLHPLYKEPEEECITCGENSVLSLKCNGEFVSCGGEHYCETCMNAKFMFVFKEYKKTTTCTAYDFTKRSFHCTKCLKSKKLVCKDPNVLERYEMLEEMLFQGIQSDISYQKALSDLKNKTQSTLSTISTAESLFAQFSDICVLRCPNGHAVDMVHDGCGALTCQSCTYEQKKYFCLICNTNFSNESACHEHFYHCDNPLHDRQGFFIKEHICWVYRWNTLWLTMVTWMKQLSKSECKKLANFKPFVQFVNNSMFTANVDGQDMEWNVILMDLMISRSNENQFLPHMCEVLFGDCLQFKHLFIGSHCERLKTILKI
jgi:hypothetical protein